MITSTRLKTCLYSFTSPGGLMYPTRAVRHAAWDALNALFPIGKYPRHVISLFFRLLYPWYWPSSCWHFAVSCTKAVLLSMKNAMEYVFGSTFVCKTREAAVKIHTTSQSSPTQAYNQAINDLDKELDCLKSAFEPEERFTSLLSSD